MASASTIPSNTAAKPATVEASRHEDEAHVGQPSQPVHQISDSEKETLAAYEGHDVDTPSNEGYVLDENGESRRRQSIARAALSRKASHASRRSETPNGAARTDLEKGREEIAAEEDSNVVFWDCLSDPSNPLNFGKWRKVLNIALVSALCFVTPLGSSMFAPGVPELMEEFKITNVLLATFVVSVGSYSGLRYWATVLCAHERDLWPCAGVPLL